MGQLGCNGHIKAGFDYLKPYGFSLYLPPRLRVLDLLLPTRQWAVVFSFCSLACSHSPRAHDDLLDLPGGGKSEQKSCWGKASECKGKTTRYTMTFQISLTLVASCLLLLPASFLPLLCSSVSSSAACRRCAAQKDRLICFRDERQEGASRTKADCAARKTTRRRVRRGRRAVDEASSAHRRPL